MSFEKIIFVKFCEIILGVLEIVSRTIELALLKPLALTQEDFVDIDDQL